MSKASLPGNSLGPALHVISIRRGGRREIFRRYKEGFLAALEMTFKT